MRKIPNLDIQELVFAYSMSEDSIRHYLNTETGEIVFVSEFSMSGEEIDELDEELEDEKYLPVPQIGSHEAYEIMADFVSTVDHTDLRGALIDALEGHKPFRRFKDTLGDYPHEEQQWYKFEEQAHRKVILDWLAEEGIEVP